MAKKGYIYPIKKKIPLIILLNLFGTVIISQFSRFVNILVKIYPNYLPRGRKKPPLCKGRWVAQARRRDCKRQKNSREQSLSRLRRQLPLHKGAIFYVHLRLINFFDKHCRIVSLYITIYLLSTINLALRAFGKPVTPAVITLNAYRIYFLIGLFLLRLEC